MTRRSLGVLASLLAVLWAIPAQAQAPEPSRVRVFLDCNQCFADYLREEVDFVDYVRDREEADVHVIITQAATASRGREYTAAFIRPGTPDRTLRTVTTNSETDEVVRQQIANMLSIGLLGVVAEREVPRDLAVSVEAAPQASTPAAGGDPWNNWVFSLRGSGSFDGEEFQRETRLSGSVSADRITPEWKITVGAEFEQESERFDLDEDEPVDVERRERELRWLVVKGFGEHWSLGMDGDVESSTFQNTRLSYSAAPAIELNLFPYSAYTRRQLRLQYAAGVRHARYYEETLFGRLEETHPAHEASVAFEQTERWGSLDARVEWQQYLHDRSLNRLEARGDVSWRLAQGLSLSLQANASRVRDQIGLPRRGATPEEVLLELRQLRSNHEYGFSFGVTYTFGSIFSAIVNPRFGR